MKRTLAVLGFCSGTTLAVGAAAETRLRIMPPDGSVFASHQRFDVRVEATGAGRAAPAGLRVLLDGRDVTAENAATGGPPASANFLRRGLAFEAAGTHVIAADTADGGRAEVRITVEDWDSPRAPALRPRARNVILLLGDGMGAAHRTAARIVSRGVVNGKAKGRLAMDTLPVTGQVMTFSLNSVITDSSPGMAAYVTGSKGNNNQEGVFPDNTPDAFDNPRVEYLGELLRRRLGPGFNVGIVTTADLTDSTPAANAVHTSDRYAGPGIAAAFFDERESNAVSVLLGGGARYFLPQGPTSARTDTRDLQGEFAKAGYERLATATELKALLAREKPPARLLGLFNTSHLPVAFDKVGAGRYSEELALPKHEGWRDPPMLDDMTRLALRALEASSPGGFYLMVEGASIDKRSHDADSERTVWDVIEFDNAVAVALEFARKTNSDADPLNDTLVIVTADHECGGLALVGVGNERYAPTRISAAVRDYAAVFRFKPEQVLDFFPSYEPDAAGFPVHPDPSRKLLLGWAASPDRFENWLSNRYQRPQAFAAEVRAVEGGEVVRRTVAVVNRSRDGVEDDSDNRSVEGKAIPGFLVPGVIENGEHSCTPEAGCPGDTSSEPHTISGHTASDVPLSAEGPGALQFTGTYDNTDVMRKILRAMTGAFSE
jgi:alkaline phosphatase